MPEPTEMLPAVEFNPAMPAPATKPPVDVTDQHKDAFFKAFLADRPYTEEFALLGGHYKVVFKTLTMAENGDLLKQIAFDREQGRIEGTNDYYFSRVSHYRMGLALVSVNDKPFGEDITSATVKSDPKKGVTYVAARADALAEWTMVKIAAIAAAMVEFDQRVITLVDAVAKPDFWKAAA